jgi:hypothetical protein
VAVRFALSCIAKALPRMDQHDPRGFQSTDHRIAYMSRSQLEKLLYVPAGLVYIEHGCLL